MRRSFICDVATSFFAVVMTLGISEVNCFSYLDSLSPSLAPNPCSDDGGTGVRTTMAITTDGGYLDSLQTRCPKSEAETSEIFTTETAKAPTPTDGMAETIAETPDDHYAKDQPGAGWAGFKHPMYGGYLEHLSDRNDHGANGASEGADGDDDSALSSCILKTGKKADYGDDIRWGAQVYLDNLQ